MSLSRESKKIIIESSVYLCTSLLALYASYRLMETLSPSNTERRKSSKKGKETLERLKGSGKARLENLGDLNEYEETLLAEVVHPDDIEVGFGDVGGLEPIVDSLRESVIYPLIYPEIYNSTSGLLTAPKGVLLYGPPGCGKTMLAKALAKESGASFINVPLSALANKWYGESNKLIAGLFTLARKLQPTIIFIDEIDALLRNRGSDNHEVTSTIKAEFLTLWDGLTSGERSRILVLGATNRPNDIDPAFLRRMPKKFSVGLPDASQRSRILALMLKDTALSSSLSISHLAELTEGRSGSDLRELCREAAMRPLREEIRGKGFDPVKLGEKGFELRPLELKDFFDESSALEDGLVDG
ncbi:aaa-domain-containing protein [Phaffia rhodozyma]|uniref:Aaa-domain-containing protein n=1 Tax=Phaffia rhodozyma TaxID=264483 RepID=A0A0F7SQ08_PHARH|nr:aaa-domain-containing protein [Phaffia rhodozyma]